MEAKAKFDNDYLHLRKLVLRGKMPLADARMWMIAKGEETIQRTVVDRMNNLTQYPHIDREIVQLNKCLKNMGHTGEDDD